MAFGLPDITSFLAKQFGNKVGTVARNPATAARVATEFSASKKRNGTDIPRPKRDGGSDWRSSEWGPFKAVNALQDSVEDRANRLSLDRSPGGIGAVGTGALNALRQVGTTNPLEDYSNSGPASIPTFGKSLDDYLKQYGDGSQFAKPILEAIKARESALRSQADVGGKKISEAYSALSGSFDLGAESADKRYKEAAEQAGAVGESTRDIIEKARAGSQSARDATRANLGLADLGNSLAENYADEAGTRDISAAAAANQTQQNYLQNLGNSQSDLMQGNSRAAKFKGTEEVADLTRDLQNHLSTLDSERAGVLTDAQLQAQALAQAAYNSDYSAFTNNRDFAANRDDQAWNRARSETDMYNNYNTAQQELAAQREQARLDSQEKMSKQEDVPAYAKIQARLRQNLSSPDAAVIASDAYARALLDPSDPNYQPLDRKRLIDAGLDPVDALFALQEGLEYLKAYRK